MSISKTILTADRNAVFQALKNHSDINIIDEYGYTPLIESIIIGKVEIMNLLLTAGAVANFPDLTGRTPLHWAVDQANLEMIKSLQSHRANLNAFSSAGQPVLVMPLLREQDDIVDFLVKHGASLKFAYDFINAKIIGHLFSLKGHIDIVSPKQHLVEMDYEGFYIDTTVPLVTSSFNDYLRNFYGRKLRHLHKKESFLILETMRCAEELLLYQYYYIKRERYSAKIHNILQQKLLILPLTSSGHCIVVIRYKNWLVRCDRGEFGRRNGTAIVYEIQNSYWYENSFLENLLYQKLLREKLDALFESRAGLIAKYFIPFTAQISGNCTWANLTAGIFSSLFLLMLDQRPNIKNIETLYNEILSMYQEWQNWEKNRIINYYLDDFSTISEIHKRCYATVLAAIFIQQCNYQSTSNYEIVKKIITVLKQKKYQYIINTYIQHLKQYKQQEILQKVINFADDFGWQLDL